MKRFKRVISSLLCFGLMASMLPVLQPAAQAYISQDEVTAAGSPFIYGNSVPADWVGPVVNMEDGTDYVKLSFGVSKASFRSLAYQLQYDESIVKLVSYVDKTTETTSSTGGLAGNKAINKAFESCKMPESIVASNEYTAFSFVEAELYSADSGMATGVGEFASADGVGTVRSAWQPKAGLDASMSDYFKTGIFSSSTGWDLASINEPVYLYNLYFKKLGGAIDSNTFRFVEYTNMPTGICTAVTKITSLGACLVNFPAPPEPHGTVEVTVPDVSGLTATLSGTSAQGTDLTGEKALTATTGVGGKATFNDVPVGTNYTCTISGTGTKTDGKSYRVKADQSTKTSIAVTASTATTVSYDASAIEEVVGEYPIDVVVTDMQGNAITALTGAKISLAESEMTTTASSNTLSFKTAVSGDAKALTIGSVSGYQPRTVSLNITPVQDSTTQLSTVQLANSADSSFANATVQSGKGVVTLKLAKVATNVEIPLPVPSGDDAMSSEEVTNITANFKPTTTDAINEVGANGVTLTQDNGGIIVTIDNATKKITGIKLNATLPAGTYTVTITGNGMKTIVTTVIIKKSTDGDTIVNVGGTENEDGTITGGITGTTPDSGNTDANGNVNVDLGGGAGSNTTVTEGGTTNADGTVTGGNDLTNTGGSSGSTNTDLTPGVMSDPVYVVDMTYDNTNADDPFIMASISIKNVTGANAGTFGLEYDPKIFGGMDGKTKEQIILNMNENIEYASSADETQVVYPSDKDQPAYITVGWQMKSGKPSIGSTTKLFDIKLFGGLLFKSAIEKGDFSNASINVMPYDETVSGQRIVADAAADADMYNHLMTQNWRETALAGQLNSVHLDAALAQRGGFYQITQSSGVDGALVHHDIAMELRYPDTLTPHFAAEFLIQDKASTPNAIGGATIKVYRDSDFTTPPFAEAFNPETTKPYVTLKTSDFGRAAASVDEGKYYYTVTHPSFWDYPDGTVTTDNDGVQYDTLTVDQYGVITMQENTRKDGTKFTTSIEAVTGFINPHMEAKSYHQVSLGDMKSWTKPKATFSSLNKAYNKQDYYFSITPPSGYDWAKDMTAIATDLSAVAKLHGIDKTATSAEAAMYRVGAGSALTVTWDAARNQFKIAGAAIIGDAVGDVTFAGEVPDWYNSLRSGDIVLSLTESMFAPKDMQITVNAGEGGKVTVAEPDPARTTGTSEYTPNGGTSTDLPTGSQDAVTETLKGGRTDSAEYTFKPTTEGHLIDKVVVNGIEIPLTEPQKKEFTYQFTNVSDDESIVVTFKDGAEPANPLSKPVVTVILGANGKADVTDDSASAAPASLTGPVTQIYEGTAGKEFTVTPNPTAPYVVDKIFIDGEEKAFSDGASKIATLTADQMKLGAAHTIIVTFKDENGPSTQVVVDASVDVGLGFIYSAGIGVYSLNDTPSYTMKPYNESWYVNAKPDAKALIVQPAGGEAVDHSDKVKKDDATGLFTYTLDPLTADTVLRASFTESGITVNGILQVAATTLEAAPAKIKFERAKSEANKTDATEFEVKTGSGVTAAKQMTFTAVVPAGEWKVTVSKQGYLDYVITGFTVSGTETKDILFGVGEDPADGTTAKPIILTPGDAAGDGLSIGFADVAMVAAGWVADAKTPNRIKSDVDESLYGSADINRFSDSKDMTLVTNNYLNRRQYVTYDAFKTSAPTV